MAQVSTRIFTIPNLLSLFRLLLIPVFLVLLVSGQYIWALVVLVASSLTDFVDGYVARHFNQITRVGQLLDPAADRLFIFSTLIGLAWTGFIPWWLAGVMGYGVRKPLHGAALGVLCAIVVLRGDIKESIDPMAVEAAAVGIGVLLMIGREWLWPRKAGKPAPRAE